MERVYRAKMNILLFVVILFSISSLASPAWVEWPLDRGGNGHFYSISEFAHASWQNAEIEASGYSGGHLVSITSEAEQVFVNENIMVGPDRYHQFWIGLNDINEEGVYVWTTGELIQYSNWTIAGGQAWEPNNGANGKYAPDEDAVLMNYHFLLQNDYFGTWNDVSVVIPAPGERGIIEVPTNPLGGLIAITGQPAAKVVNVGDSTEFTVTVSSSESVSFQWRKNGNPIYGQTSPSLTLNNISHTDAGNYSVQVSDSHGVLISAPGKLTVLTAGADLPLPSPVPMAQFWETDGRVRALAEHDGTLYAGGDFHNIGQQIPGYTLFSVTGTSTVAPLNFSGPIAAIIGDSKGGYYVGGLFNKVSGVSVANVVHLNPDLTLDTDFSAQTDGYVETMVLRENTLYFGGEFTHVNGGTRRYLAAVDSSSGALLPWNPVSDNWVAKMVLYQGKLLVGGNFNMMGSAAKHYFAALDPDNGQPLDWGPSFNDRVTTIEPSGDSVFLGGNFTMADEVSQTRVAELAADGTLQPFNPEPNSLVNGIAISENTVYIYPASSAGSVDKLATHSLLLIGRRVRYSLGIRKLKPQVRQEISSCITGCSIRKAASLEWVARIGIISRLLTQRLARSQIIF